MLLADLSFVSFLGRFDSTAFCHKLTGLFHFLTTAITHHPLKYTSQDEE